MSIKVCCAALHVGRPGYYRWLRAREQPRYRDAVLSELREIREEHKHIGVWQMHRRLRRTRASYGTVYRLCKAHELMANRKPHGITKRDKSAKLANDLVQRDFYADKPMTKLLNDMTEIKCQDGKLYLAATLDCFDGAIVGMRMDDNKRAELCKASLESAVQRYGKTKDMIVHSDHGSQYTSNLFRDYLKVHDFQPSMGAVGSCYDNARMESFFATLKKELIYTLPLTQLGRDEVKRLIFRWIECEYNRLRPHSGNEGDLPPLERRNAYYVHEQAA